MILWQQKPINNAQLCKPTPNIHHALRITEILENVIGYLAKKDLLNLAMTSKAFEDCALDALWGNSEITIHIILQPLRAAKIIQKDILLGPPCVSRPLSVKEFPRFRSYMRRIKWLNWNAKNLHPALVHSLFYTMFERLQTPLPRLSKLAYTQDQDDNMNKCLYFMTGSLKDLTVFRNSTEDLATWSRCLSTLPTRCPDLTHLGLQFNSGNSVPSRLAEIEQFLGGLLPKLPRIKSFQLLVTGGVSKRFFQQLGHMPLLTELAVTIFWNLHPFNRGNQLTPSFLHLERLQIVPAGNVQTLENLRNLFLACKGAPLSELRITFTNKTLFTSSSSFVRHALQAYSESHGSQSSLKVVLIRPCVFRPSPGFAADEDHYLDLSHLTPLFKSCYQNLEELKIELPLIYNLIDSDLELLGSHLPKLTSLALAHDIGDVMKDWPVPRVTLYGLIGLTERCPHLRHLVLAINLFAISSLSEAPSPDINHPVPALCIWNVANSHIRDTESVAVTLARRLPHLVDLREMSFSWAVLGGRGQREPGYSFAPLESSDPWAKRSHNFSIMGRFLYARRRIGDRSPEGLHLLWMAISKRWEETEACRKKKATTLRSTVKGKLSSLFQHL